MAPSQKNLTLVTMPGFLQTPKPRLVVKEALILVSTYHSTLLSRIGGSDTLESKREFFAKQLLAHHAKRNYNHTGLGITISRTPSVVESTYQVKQSADSRKDLAFRWCFEWFGELHTVVMIRIQTNTRIPFILRLKSNHLFCVFV